MKYYGDREQDYRDAKWKRLNRIEKAAPDLLSALENMHYFLSRIESFLQENEMWGDEEQDLLEANQRVIAKAKGEA